MGDWGLARGLDPEAAATAIVESVGRGVEQGTDVEEVRRRVLEAMLTGDELPF